MYRISSATAIIIMEVPQQLLIYAFSVTLAYYGISITVFVRHLLQSVFSTTLDLQRFSEAQPLQVETQKFTS